MLIIVIITGLIALASGIVGLIRGIKSDWDEGSGWGILFIVFGIIWLIAFLMSLNFSLGIQHYTGYIYATGNKFGYTTAEIRYSQNAGTDTQPSICVASNSVAAQKLLAVVGTNTKVDITVPSYFYFAENPFACGTIKTTVTTIKGNPSGV